MNTRTLARRRMTRMARTITLAAIVLAAAAALPLPSSALHAQTKTITVRADREAIMIYPGPAPMADSAAAVIAKMPPEAQKMMGMMAKMGPFSNNAKAVTGTFRMEATDAGASGDAVNAVAEFTDAQGAKWRVVTDRLATKDEPMLPHFGGVVTDWVSHGSTGMNVPLVPTVRDAVSLWGLSRVWKDGKLVTDAEPTHIMVTSRTRGDASQGYAYQCWNCTQRPMGEVHVMLRPKDGMGVQLPSPGGFIHAMWEQSAVETH